MMNRRWLHALAAALAGLSTAGSAGPLVWVCPEGYKADRFGAKIFTLDRSVRLDALKQRNAVWDSGRRAIALCGARGEVLAFQLVMEAGPQGLNNVNVSVSDLKSRDGAVIPAAQAELFKIYYTPLKGKGSGPTNRPSMGEGWYPDALVPWCVGDTPAYGGYDGPPFTVPAGEAQAVWVDVTVPCGTAPGTYEGAVSVCAGAETTRLSLVLKVYGFDIPRAIHPLFFMNFDVANLSQAGGFWLQGDALARYEDEVYRIARRHRFTAGNMYSLARPGIEETVNGLVRVDWRGYDSRFDRVLNPTNNIFGPGEAPIEIWKVPLWAMLGRQWPANDKAWDQMVAEIKRHWQERGWDLSRAYAYLADEPGEEAAVKLNDYARRIRRAPGPALRRQIAVYGILGPTWRGQQRIFDLWQDNLDMWMVAGDFYHVPGMNALLPGRLRGMYQGGEPYQGNETLDADGIAMRTWSWIAWQYRIDYQCYYAMDEAWRGYDEAARRQRDNKNCEIWDQPRNRRWAISQGVFIYPGRRVNYDLPIVNIRMKQIRRGQTDYEYFWLLRGAGEGALADALCKRVLHVALSEAASAPEQYEAGKWSHNPADWDEAIRRAGERLDELGRK